MCYFRVTGRSRNRERSKRSMSPRNEHRAAVNEFRYVFARRSCSAGACAWERPPVRHSFLCHVWRSLSCLLSQFRFISPISFPSLALVRSGPLPSKTIHASTNSCTTAGRRRAASPPLPGPAHSDYRCHPSLPPPPLRPPLPLPSLARVTCCESSATIVENMHES